MKLFIIGVLLAAAAVSADDKITGPTVRECWTHSVLMGKKDETLPAFYEICAKLGVSKSKCDDHSFFVFDASSQTDPALWYSGESGQPDDSPSALCYGAVPVKHYWTWDGTRGTNYACMVKPEVDMIVPAEIEAIRRYAEHLNSIGKKTLRDHEEAMYVKQFAEMAAKGE